MNLSELVETANELFTSAYRNKVVNGKAGSKPRFERYHAAPSLCSMQVRTVLAEKQAHYRSHDLNLRGANSFSSRIWGELIGNSQPTGRRPGSHYSAEQGIDASPARVFRDRAAACTWRVSGAICSHHPLEPMAYR